MDGIIIKDDARYRYTEDYLLAKGHTFLKPDTEPKDLDFIIFPFMEEIDKAVYVDGFFKALRCGTYIFTGVRKAYAAEKCEKYGLEYHVITEDRGVAVKNAVPTSEGVIAYMISNSAVTIAGSRALIIGYGVCGSDIAKRLRALNADVHALVRNTEKECIARADGVTPVYINGFDAGGFDFIINTVPGCVLPDETLEKTGGALLIDMASKPYGFDMNIAKKLNEKSALLPGLPGKYAVRTAGEILGEYIHKVLTGGS